MKERTILHSDVNNFFASVECTTRPELKDKPVAVAGNPKKRTGIILAKNEIAKKFGVKTGQTIWEAQIACPELVCLLPHYDIYEKISKQLHKIYLEYTDKVEPLGLDECWLDVTGCEKYLGKNGKQIADEIRLKIKQMFGFTVSVGVSFNKIFAKLGSDMKKPDATTIIDRSNFKQLTYSLPLNTIVGIGGRLERKFKKINIKTIGQYIELEDNFLKEYVNKTAVELKQQLLGIDNFPVLSYYHLPPPKSIGNGSTTLKDITSRKDISKLVYFLSEKVSSRLIAQNYEAKTIGISVKTNEMKRFGKSYTVSPTYHANIIAETAMKILDSFWEYNIPIRSVRVRASNLIEQQVEQLSMFDIKKDASKTISAIQEKYGKIIRASDLASYINRANNPHE